MRRCGHSFQPPNNVWSDNVVKGNVKRMSTAIQRSLVFLGDFQETNLASH